MKSSSLLNRHIMAVMENEWSQLIRNKVVVFTTLGPTFLLVVLAILMLAVTGLISLDDQELNRAAGGALGSVLNDTGSVFQGSDLLRAKLLDPFLILFQVIPLVVPVTIASYSIVGEKQQRSLEPLLATPIKTWELLTAKALSAAIPGILSTWWGFALFALVGRFVSSDAIYQGLILSQTWLLAIVLLTPTFTFLAVGTGVIISSRARDPHSAQQLGSLVILPVIGMLLAQVAGAIQVGVGLVLAIALGVALLDVLLLMVSVRLFRREEILTGWQ